LNRQLLSTGCQRPHHRPGDGGELGHRRGGVEGTERLDVGVQILFQRLLDRRVTQRL